MEGSAQQTTGPENSLKEKVGVDNICRICREQSDTIEHLVLKCHIARDTWYSTSCSFSWLTTIIPHLYLVGILVREIE